MRELIRWLEFQASHATADEAAAYRLTLERIRVQTGLAIGKPCPYCTPAISK